MTSGAQGTGAGRWWIAGFTVLLVGILTVQLLWLTYRYVPMHLAFADGMGMPIPYRARLVHTMSMWTIRAAPFAVLASVPLGALVLVSAAILLQKVNLRLGTLVDWLTRLGLVVALAESLVCAYVVHAIQEVHQLAATSPAYQQTLRDFDAYRRQKPAQPNPDPGAR